MFQCLDIITMLKVATSGLDIRIDLEKDLHQVDREKMLVSS